VQDDRERQLRGDHADRRDRRDGHVEEPGGEEGEGAEDQQHPEAVARPAPPRDDARREIDERDDREQHEDAGHGLVVRDEQRALERGQTQRDRGDQAECGAERAGCAHAGATRLERGLSGCYARRDPHDRHSASIRAHHRGAHLAIANRRSTEVLRKDGT
jgi:hypothetical protein